MLLNTEEIDQETQALIDSLLPDTAKDIVRLIGFDAAWKIINEFGGREIKIPWGNADYSTNRFSAVVEIIGHENGLRLMKEMGGEEPLYVPSCHRLMLALRNRKIIRDWDELSSSMSGRRASEEVSKRYHISHRSVENIISGGYKPKAKMKGGTLA